MTMQMMHAPDSAAAAQEGADLEIWPVGFNHWNKILSAKTGYSMFPAVSIRVHDLGETKLALDSGFFVVLLGEIYCCR